jgi:16S rRNA (uracil1498-N3)-methyltransferase
LEHLSNIEIFYSTEISGNEIRLESEEFNHCVNVFRKRLNDDLYITDGLGNLFKTQIVQIKNNSLISEIIDKFYFSNTTENFFICIPLLKNKDRFRFVIEKCVELGITSFCFFTSERTIPTKFDGEKVKKIMIESLKQSIRTHLPKFDFYNDFSDLIDQTMSNGEIFLFDLESSERFNKELINSTNTNYFVFGPEGGLSKKEIEYVENDRIFNLSSARLRTETAIIKLVSIIT